MIIPSDYDTLFVPILLWATESTPSEYILSVCFNITLGLQCIIYINSLYSYSTTKRVKQSTNNYNIKLINEHMCNTKKH
jgi:hypothetical protein